jgi:hypothetical protein
MAYIQSIQTCRFCKKADWEDARPMVKYGVRHYAHGECYLRAGKPLAALSDYQVGKLPYFTLKELGLLADVETRLGGTDP